MEEEKLNELIQILTNSVDNFIPIEFLSDQLNSNFLDINENNYFHYLSSYSFKYYCISNYNITDNDIINNSKYNSLFNIYIERIISFVNILININCDINYKNLYEQSPLESCIAKKNYYIAKEYLNYEKFLDSLFFNNYINLIFEDNCIKEDCINFIIHLFNSSEAKISDENIKNFLNKRINNEQEITPFISIIKDFNNYIYRKFNKLIKINCIEYLNSNGKGKYIFSFNEKNKNIIIEKSVIELNDFCLTKFYNILNTLLEKKADINYIENYTDKNGISAFMYLMAYPFIPELDSFIHQNNVNINYQDYLGRTPLIHLINNKNNIIKINENIYNEAFKTLINFHSLDITKRDINGISPFLLCLINEYFEDAKKIYDIYFYKYLSIFNLDFLFLFIIKIYKNELNKTFILNFQNYFENRINFDLLDKINDRTLLHYFFMFLSNADNDYITNLNLIIDLVNEKNKKDVFNRNCLFYLFIDFSGDPKKIKDPFEILHYCFINNLFQFSINEKDILGNNLLIYATRCGFVESIKILLNNGANLDDSIDNEGNNIYSMALMANESLFFYLYENRKVYIDLNQIINVYETNYESYKIQIKNEFLKYEDNTVDSNENTQIINMYDFFHDPELTLMEGYNYIEEKNKVKKILTDINNSKKIENDYRNIEEKNDDEFTVFDLLSEEQKKAINSFIKDNFDFKFEYPLKKISLIIFDKNFIDISSILENPKNFIEIVKKSKKCIFTDNIFKYAIKFNKIEFINKFLNKLNKIDLCKNYLESNNYEGLTSNLIKIIDEIKDINKIADLKNKNEESIFNILALANVENNEQLIKIYDKLKKFNIDNLFDSFGNSPIYYACKKFNKKFIETFSNYSFDNFKNNEVNTKIFIESKSNNTPLKELYDKLNLNNDDLLKLIIKITLQEQTGYMKYILDYLINNYRSKYKKDLDLHYKINLSNSNYLNRILGIYQYLKNNLNYSIMIEDEKGNDPFMKCALRNNFDFCYDILLNEESDISLLKNRTNKEGKSFIHLIIESEIINKKEMLLQIIKEGFSFNIKDNKGFCPIDYAYFNKEKEIFNILKNLYYKEGLPLKINSLFNFYKDSDTLYKESIQISSKYQQCDDLYGLVCDKYKNNGNKIYKVCIDNESIPYSTVLLKGNPLYVNCLFKKYILQIIENIKTNKFIVIFCDNEIEYINLDEAENKFKIIFKEKTNNNWDDVKKDKTKFKTDPKHYYYFDYDCSQELDIYEYLNITINNLIIKKKLKYDKNYKVRDLIYYLARKAYKNRFNKDNDSKEVIKNFKNKGIQDSIYLLNKIEKLIKSEIFYESEKREKAYLLNCYLELIPFSIHKTDNNLLNSIEEINEENGRITTFYFIENIFKIFLGAIKNLDEMHPLDYIINSLGCNIIELKENNEEKRYIKQFLINTDAKTIKDIFKITESINDINFNPNNFKKRYIFFHGTKTENILGILSEGLKISPAQAKFTGNTHGDGIYLSDSFRVSIIYTKNKTYYGKDYYQINNKKNEDDKTFILLVEAALGEKNEDYKLVNVNLDKETYITEDGYGILKKDNYERNDGVIVIKNAMNVRIKYIIEVDN